MKHLLLSAILVVSLSTVKAQSAPTAQSTAENLTPQQKFESARDLASHGRLDQAMALLDELAATTPEPAGVERLRGLILYQRDKLTDAVEAFKKAVQQDPADKEAIEMEGVSLFRLGRPADAVPLLETSRTTVLNANIDPQYVLALCYIDTDRYDDARHAFAAQFDFPPDSAEAYLLSARMFLRRDFPDQAIAAARKAIVLNPKLALAHQLLGEAALAKADIPAAITDLQAEIADNPMEPAAYERLGDAYVRAGKYNDARVALNRAVLLEPGATAPFILLGQAFLKLQQPIEALHYLTHAAKMDPNNYVTHNLLGQAYKATGQLAEANREFKLVVELQQKQNSAASGK